MLKKIILVTGVVALSVLLLVISPVTLRVEPANKAEASNGDGCPDGSYNIGTKDGVNPICKLEPTGCPFGDSVPMDKCAPPPDITCNADWTKCEPKKINEGNTNVESNSEVRDTRSTESQEEHPTSCNSGK